jgi:hypothetical protein
MSGLYVTGFFAGMMVSVCASQSVGQQLCRPTLALKEAQMSDMKPPTMHRKWTAALSVDASICAASAGGRFDVVFIRLKETAPDLEFREHFSWGATPVVNVEVDFSADEAVERFWIDNVTPCPCRR